VGWDDLITKKYRSSLRCKELTAKWKPYASREERKMLRLSISLLLVHVFVYFLSFTMLAKAYGIAQLSHAVLAKVQSAFYVEEVRSVKPRFQVKSPFCAFLLEHFYCVGQLCK